jgi:hypothetical protein
MSFHNELSMDGAAAFLLGGAAPAASAAAPAGANAAVDGADADDHAGEVADSAIDGLDEGTNSEADDFSFLDEEDKDQDQPDVDPTALSEKNPADDKADDEAGSDDQGDALPPIEPPASWSDEEKAEWKGLSRKAQETVQRREQDLTKALRTAQNSTAEQRKAAETEVTRIKGLAAQVESVVNRDVAQLAADFPEIRSEIDVAVLAKSDPARFAEFQGRMMALQATQRVHTEAVAEAAKVDKVKADEALSQARDALLEAFPGVEGRGCCPPRNYGAARLRGESLWRR